MLQLELGSDKEHAHMCAWCSRMIAPDPNEKSANTQGCGARRAFGHAFGKEPRKAGRGTIPT